LYTGAPKLTFTSGLVSSEGVAIGPDGNLYVADGGTGAVLRFNPSSGAFLSTFVVPNSSSKPNGITFDVEIEAVDLRDGWRLRFEESFSRIEGVAFFTALIERGSASTFHLQDVWINLSLVGELSPSFPLLVRFRDGQRGAWKAICEIRRDNRLSPTGFDVRLLNFKRFRDSLKRVR
jgi:hypothetical protein